MKINQNEKIKTLILKLENNSSDEEKLIQAANILRSGGTVIFPTETVYGLGADALDENAAKKIYMAKGRPSDNPLIIHISSEDQLYQVTSSVDEGSKKLMDAFWPGPLTIIFKKSSVVPDDITGGLQTVAVRMPSNNAARRLIELSGIPVAAPSANISGRPSITSSDYLVEEMDGKVDAIMIDEDSPIGLESTVIDMTRRPAVILRPGKITRTQIEKVLGEIVLNDEHLENENSAPLSPGMKYRHYSPSADVIVAMGSEEKMRESITSQVKKDTLSNKKTAIAAIESRYESYADFCSSSGCTFISLGKDEAEAAHNLFRILRKADTLGIDRIYFEALPQGEISEAIMNRLLKACAGNII